jgi:hypothetical protein
MVLQRRVRVSMPVMWTGSVIRVPDEAKWRELSSLDELMARSWREIGEKLLSGTRDELDGLSVGLEAATRDLSLPAGRRTFAAAVLRALDGLRDSPAPRVWPDYPRSELLGLERTDG